MKKKDKSKTDRVDPLGREGFSLVEALAAMGIGGIILAAVTYAFVNAKKQEVLFTVKEDAFSLNQELDYLLKGTACGISKLSMPESKIPLDSTTFFESSSNIIDLSEGLSSGQLSLRPGDVYGKVKINSVSIAPKRLATTATPTFQYVKRGPRLILAQVVVNVDNTTGTAMGDARTFEVRQDVFLHLDSEGREIINCSNLQQVTVLQEGCDAFGGQWDDEQMSCTLASTSPSGEATTCPFNDICSASPEFKL